MKSLPIALLAAAVAPAAPALAQAGGVQSSGADYAPLKLYDGRWRVTPVDAAGVSKPVALTDSCSQAGTYYVCQQTVAGAVGGLIVFVPAGERGKWKTQFVAPTGAAGPQPGDLTITGDTWIYLTRETTPTGSLITRVINRFADPDHIHFEKSQSIDGTRWTQQLVGDEVRIK